MAHAGPRRRGPCPGRTADDRDWREPPAPPGRPTPSLRDDSFKRAIEEIKARLPVEEVVRERVPGLRRAGSLWAACCPFHEEKTPSFKVDPRRGTWHCFGSCGTGGDQISFVQRFDNLEFLEALEQLASRAGVELPRRGRGDDAARRRFERLYEAVAWARERFARSLRGPEGRGALNYLLGRGLAAETAEAFGVGFAPGHGRALVEAAGAGGPGLDELLEVGLVRRNDTGRPYDFFRGRMTIPIADDRGRPVGFGARRLGDGGGGEPDGYRAGPKYINTPETPLFKKSQLVYGLDLARDHVRRSGHLVLVEGYTDVMAAHQVGLRTVAAVLGTATTDEHARLVRRAGARRVTLVFDGDEAGGGATRKALAGLLPLEVDLDVVRLPAGVDPCDWLLREGREAFEQLLAEPVDWFPFCLASLEGLTGQARLHEVDEILELVGRLPQALAREERLAQLADHLGTPIEGVREAFSALHERRPRPGSRPGSHGGSSGARATRASGRTPARPAAPSAEAPPAREDRARRGAPGLRRAYGELVGAVLLDNSLAPLALPRGEGCPIEDVGEVLRALGALHRRGVDPLDVDALLAELADSRARDLVVPIREHAARAESPQALLDGALGYLERLEVERSLDEGRRLLADGGDDAAIRDRLTQLHVRLRAIKVPGAANADPAEPGAPAAGTLEPHSRGTESR